MAKAGRSEEELNKRFAELVPVEIVPGTERLLTIFHHLNLSRQSGTSGPNGLQYTEIAAYCDLMNETLTPMEVATIRSMDAAFLEECNKNKD
jgi:hypothetical protein